MSEVITEIVWSSSQSRRGSRLVMLALARAADDTGRANLTRDYISRLTGLTPRSITKCLGELTSLGEISYQRGGGNDNPNSYSILLTEHNSEPSADERTEVPPSSQKREEEGRNFQDVSSKNQHKSAGSGKSVHGKAEVSSSRARGVSTPYGSTNTYSKQASLPKQACAPSSSEEHPVDVPEGAKELVAAMTSAGMLVGWRLTEAEWSSVTALADRWSPARLVEMVARRWNSAHPPQSARYLLRIWADLPSQGPADSDSPAGIVVPLRTKSGGWIPFRNPTEPSAYENGF